MSGWEQKSQEDARLVILAELARQVDETLSLLSIHRVVDAMEMRRDRDWVETQCLKLAALGAITLRTVDLPGLGAILVASITEAGRAHVERRSRIAGVTPPRGTG